MALPDKLWKLKGWLTVPEAARHLSLMFGEEVNEADVLRLALDGHLKLSVNFVNGTAARRGGKILQFEEWEEIFRSDNSSWEALSHFFVTWDKKLAFFFAGNDGPIALTNADSITELMRPEALKNDYLSKCTPDQQTAILCAAIEKFVGIAKKQAEEFGGKVLPTSKSFREEISSITGVWDLPFIGSERLDIEHEYQQLTGGPEVTLVCLEGTFVEGQDGEICGLQERFNDEDFGEVEQELIAAGGHIPDSVRKKDQKERANTPYRHPSNYYPAGKLPDDSVLVVRTSALTDLQVRLEEEGEEEAKSKATVKEGIGCHRRSTRDPPMPMMLRPTCT